MRWVRLVGGGGMDTNKHFPYRGPVPEAKTSH